ncbi:MAG: PTS glucose transporter subunit IIB, partial [Lachnospiraceae bacterium]|nr:PTS glucose transporter subunit IIB [Lachnospiraceae bacterium]
KALCRVANAALPAGVLGVGEPLIYGVTLPLGRPFVTASIGAGFGGAFIMTMEVASTTWGPSGVLGVFVMTAGPHGFVQNAIVYMASLLIACLGGYIVTQLFLKEKELAVKEDL